MYLRAALALNPIRRRFFELFRASHWLFVMAYVFAIMHSHDLAKYAGASFALYGLDWCLRIYRRFCSWQLVGLSFRGPITKLELLSPPNFTHTPGQYCFINIPAVSIFEWHPFSITSDPIAVGARDSLGRLRVNFAIKAHKEGSWTKRLLDLASKQPTPVPGVSVNLNQEDAETLKQVPVGHEDDPIMIVH